jgi:competence protein ComEC
MYKKMYIFILEQFNRDQKSWILWLVAFFCFGIIIYFALPTEPNIFILIIITIFLVSSIIFYRKKNVLGLLILALCITFGMIIAQLRTIYVISPKLIQEIKYAKIYGRIINLTPTINGLQIILDHIYISEFNNKNSPKKVKITIRSNNLNDLQVGDYIKLKANLKPPSKPLVPGGYNFARQSYFEQIGATGYNVSKIYVTKKNKNKFSNYIANLRIDLSQRIKKILGDRNGAIAAALIIGEQTAIDKDILSDMRISGLTHILSVSGLHLSMVSIICFFSIRFLFSCSVFISQQYDTKKIAAYFSLFITFGYLLISGMQIAAIRSYIMVLCVAIAVLLDRQEYALRSVCFAAFIMLLFTPEAIMHPSFQMSFAAVIALVSGYEYYVNKCLASGGNLARIKRYFLGTLTATFIAGIATAPFAVYHFNQYPNYSLLANLIVAPITSFIIMPAVVMTCILFPFSLEKYALIIMNFGIEFLVRTAHWISSLPKALIMLPNMGDINIMLFFIGLLWLCLWQQKWRIFGIIPIIGGIILLLLTPKPDLIIDLNAGNVLLRSLDNNLIKTLNKPRLSQFMQDYLNSKMQTNSIVSINESRYSEEFNCNDNQCFIEKNYKLYFPKNRLVDNSQIYVQWQTHQEFLLTNEAFKNKGSYFIILKPDKIKIESTVDSWNRRPWS